VNTAFERLFGYSQDHIKLLFLQEGRKVIGRFLKWDDPECPGYRSIIAKNKDTTSEVVSVRTCINKWQNEFTALFVKKSSSDAYGKDY
jgi:hypothetical protein